MTTQTTATPHRTVRTYLTPGEIDTVAGLVLRAFESGIGRIWPMTLCGIQFYVAGNGERDQVVIYAESLADRRRTHCTLDTSVTTDASDANARRLVATIVFLTTVH